MSASPLVPVVGSLPQGIVHVALPTPFPVGPVNCYVLLGEPVTVIDPGMVWADSAAQLEATLRAVGLEVADIEQVVITHGHPDHFGAAGWLADAADASIVCGRAEQPKLTGQVDRSAMLQVVDQCGLPTEMHAVFRMFYERVREISSPIREDRLVLVDDGDTLRAGGRSWQVHVTPGHAVGHVSLFDAEARVLLSGDHLLACITPNPVLEPDGDSADGRRRSLVEYIASLERFVRLDPVQVLPGHGPWFEDVPQLAAVMRQHHQSRADEILERVERLGSATPYELSRDLFPHIQGFSVMLGISEVVGHLDLLEDDGRLARGDGSPHRYHPV